MAIKFLLHTTQKTGTAKLFIRQQTRKINYLFQTPITVDVAEWMNASTSQTKLDNYRIRCKDLWRMLDQIRDALNMDGVTTSEQASQLVHDIYYADEIKAAKDKAAEAKRQEEESKRMTLNRYIDKYIADIESGARATERGTNFAKGTVKAMKQAMTVFALFQRETGRTVDFSDVDMAFYNAYTEYLKKKDYNVNSIGKAIKSLKTVLSNAESDGVNHYTKYRDRRFKGTRVDVDNIYLTREELQRMMDVDLSGLPKCYEQARDIFMVGVWTAQRVSDYNHLDSDDIQKECRMIQVVRDGKVAEKELTTIRITQQKTKKKVAIPVNTELKKILERYNYHLPHVWEQHLNEMIKKIGEMAGLIENVKITTTKGGDEKLESVPKYRLIHSHTARRTGATLMYLSGMDVYDIMKVTGHSSPVMLEKYIKADTLESALKNATQYDYFD